MLSKDTFDIYNYIAIDMLESLENLVPTQHDINKIEKKLKEFFAKENIAAASNLKSYQYAMRSQA